MLYKSDMFTAVRFKSNQFIVMELWNQGVLQYEAREQGLFSNNTVDALQRAVVMIYIKTRDCSEEAKL